MTPRSRLVSLFPSASRDSPRHEGQPDEDDAFGLFAKSDSNKVRSSGSLKVGVVGQFQSMRAQTAESLGGFSDVPSAVVCWRRILASMEQAVRSREFEGIFALLIVLNTCVIALEVQYQGMDHAYRLQIPGSELHAAQAWPWAEGMFKVMEALFGTLFTLELLAKILVLRSSFIHSAWNWFDSFVILCWLIEFLLGLSVGVNPMMLRLARLTRLLRVARNFKTIQAFDSLNLLIGSIGACGMILFWSTVLLTAVHTMVALFINYALESYMLHADMPVEARTKAYAYFGTFTRSFVTMWELTMGNYVPICRVLMDNVNEWWGVFMLIYKCSMGFAVMKVITGVFMQSTFAVAASDDDLMVIQKQRAGKILAAKMRSLLGRGDMDGDGVLDRDEFVRILKTQTTATWLSSMEVEVGDAGILFDMIDDGDGQLTLDELIRGISRLKGGARSIDMCMMLNGLATLQRSVEDVQQFMGAKVTSP
jgi:hypothetical protein